MREACDVRQGPATGCSMRPQAWDAMQHRLGRRAVTSEPSPGQVSRQVHFPAQRDDALDHHGIEDAHKHDAGVLDPHNVDDAVVGPGGVALGLEHRAEERAYDERDDGAGAVIVPQPVVLLEVPLKQLLGLREEPSMGFLALDSL